jgi:hypothetical protein
MVRITEPPEFDPQTGSRGVSDAAISAAWAQTPRICRMKFSLPQRRDGAQELLSLDNIDKPRAAQS